jgi:hypothetical protein
MSAKRDTMVRFREAFEAFEALVTPLSDDELCVEAMDCWSVRDIAFHFAGYHDSMAGVIECIARGEPPEPADALTDDQCNAVHAAKARVTPPGEVLLLWRGAFERCFHAAASLPKPRFEDAGGVRCWLLEEAEHYDGHASQVRGWLRRA